MDRYLNSKSECVANIIRHTKNHPFRITVVRLAKGKVSMFWQTAFAVMAISINSGWNYYLLAEGSFFFVVMFAFVIYFPLQAAIAWLFVIPCSRVNKRNNGLIIAVGFVFSPLALLVVGVSLLWRLSDIIDFSTKNDFATLMMGLTVTAVLAILPLYYVRKWSREWNESISKTNPDD